MTADGLSQGEIDGFFGGASSEFAAPRPGNASDRNAAFFKQKKQEESAAKAAQVKMLCTDVVHTCTHRFLYLFTIHSHLLSFTHSLIHVYTRAYRMPRRRKCQSSSGTS
jgi:hypothetical protein